MYRRADVGDLGKYPGHGDGGDGYAEATVTILLTPDEDRETVGVRSVTKATLAPRETAQRRLCITANGAQAVEMQNGVPGQMGLDGNTQAAGIKLRIRKAAARMEAE